MGHLPNHKFTCLQCKCCLKIQFEGVHEIKANLKKQKRQIIKDYHKNFIKSSVIKLSQIASASQAMCHSVLCIAIVALGGFEANVSKERNRDRFCKTTTSVALVDTWIQSDWRLLKKEILSTSNLKQTKPQKFL